MKILWIVNTIFPYPAEKIGIEKSVFGGWLNGLAMELEKNSDIELAIATVYKGNEIKKFNDNKIIYYLLPGAPATKYKKKLEKDWEFIKDDFKPDLVHIHGTEFTHGLAFINACPEIKNVISIQGLVSECAKVYCANISKFNIIKNITFRDVLRKDNLFQQKRKFFNRGKYEIELIRKTNNIIGRTTWDKEKTKAISSNTKYYLVNETLRGCFYNKNWNIDNIERYAIFTSQASYPIKGLHYLLEAIYILKNTYSDIKLYIAGENILKKDTLKSKIRLSGYAKYLTKLIKKYNLEKNIVFTGMLDEEKMVDRLLKTHVFVLPSAIENSSNSLGEAMLLRNAMCSFKFWRNTRYVGTWKGRIFIYLYRTVCISRIYSKAF